MALLPMMATNQSNKSNNNSSSCSNNNNNNNVDVIVNAKDEEQEKKTTTPTTFHDFLGMSSGGSNSCVVLASKTSRFGAAAPSEASPSASNSDLGTERQIGSHLDGIPFNGPRGDLSGPEISNKLSGSKRSISDSVFLGSSRDGMPKMVPDSVESSHLLKMLRSGGGERTRRPYDEEMSFGMKSIRPTSASTLLQPPSGSRTDTIISKWDRNIPLNVGSAMQHLSRGGQFAPFVQQINSSRFRDASAGPSVISQPAADEGSRTGIKGSGILGSLNAKDGVSERNQPWVLPSGNRLKSDGLTADPESTTLPSRQGLSSANRQMTIFYSGQAHVFDNVHPNKADVIMALAGSNGGSWSTTYSPNSTIRGSPLEEYMLHGEHEMGTSSNLALARDIQGRLPTKGNSPRGIALIDRMPLTPGGHQTGVVAKDTRTPVQVTEPRNEEKRVV